MIDIEMADTYPLGNGTKLSNGIHTRDLFSTPVLIDLTGKQYVNGASVLAEQVAYALSSSIFRYNDGLPDGDSAVNVWSKSSQENSFGKVPSVEQLETRSGAGLYVLGHSTAEDGNHGKYPDSVFAASATVGEMQTALSHLSRDYVNFKPVVGHVAAVDSDYTAHFVADYVTPLRTARESGVAAIISNSANEIQYTSILASLFSTVLPTLHIYDGVKLARELVQVSNILPALSVKQLYDSVLSSVAATKKGDVLPQLTNLLGAFNASFNSNVSFFEYVGHPTAQTVLVVLGSTESTLANAVVNVLARQGIPVGVVNVRIYQPFSDPEFLVTLPRTTKRIAVLGQIDTFDVHSILFEDVLAAVASTGANADVLDIKYRRQQTWSTQNFSWIFQQLVSGSKEISLTPEAASQSLFNEPHNQSVYAFWDIDDSKSSIARDLARAFANDSALSIAFNETYDNFSQSGIRYSELHVGQTGSIVPTSSVELADFVVVGDVAITNSFDVVGRVVPGGSILLKTTIKTENLETKLPAPLRQAVYSRRDDINIYTINLKDLPNETPEHVILEIAFLKVIGADPKQSVKALNGFANLDDLRETIYTALQKLSIPESWSEIEEQISLPSIPRGNSYASNAEKVPAEPEPRLGTWHTAVQQIIFKESHEFQNVLRPELPVKNWVVKVQENKRLTPLSYERNIFHIEFDLTGTDLTYSIGEALGIHGRNDEKEVEFFCSRYGLDPKAVISVPAKEYPGHYETKTIRQLFVQNLDIFGKPGKKFYESLAEFATDEKEKGILRALGGPAGAAEFKRRSDVETVTFADILEEFPSARPSLSDLITLIPPIKRREYSIASSQKVHLNSVHLLVVEVNWRDTKSRDRFGHCTRYLSQLPIGAKVTVSVKPSVMKLPAEYTTPIIMAGLGTGLAPFRAFVEERALQRAQGHEIGPVFLYMGSRHQREEYLYVIFYIVH
jgi:sulfite reductase (NADPH) flavoprotein alpha-component